MDVELAKSKDSTAVSVPVKLFISGVNLKNRDTTRKPDLQCVVSERAHDNPNTWIEVGRTEFQKDNLSPNFQTAIEINFYYERPQPLKFEFIDDDGSDVNDYYDVFAVNTMYLASIMASRDKTLTKTLFLADK